MKEKKKRARRLYRRIKVRYVIIVFALIAGTYIATHQPMRIPINTSGDDVLYYTYTNHNRNSNDPNEGMLMMYDPRTNQHDVVMPHPSSYSISSDGRIAYHNEGRNIVISDVQNVDNLYAIILTLSDQPRLLSWSYDGQYLAYTDVNSLGEQNIYIWNGETSANITPDEHLASVDSYYITPWWPSRADSTSGWSTDGKLIFTAVYHESSSVGHELYIWDGETTHNFSQNPNGDDRNASWNSNGQVAFLSEVDGQYYIKVWDGISLTEGKPHNTGLTVGATDLNNSLSWSPDNKLAYMNEYVMYLWNGVTTENISQRYGWYAPDFNEAGFLAFTSINSYGTGYDVHIWDKNNQTIEILEGGFSAWSEDGYLATCRDNSLVLFDGEDVITINSAESSSVGRWQSGQGVICMTSA